MINPIVKTIELPDGRTITLDRLNNWVNHKNCFIYTFLSKFLQRYTFLVVIRWK